jgi:hypothetical protein
MSSQPKSNKKTNVSKKTESAPVVVAPAVVQVAPVAVAPEVKVTKAVVAPQAQPVVAVAPQVVAPAPQVAVVPAPEDGKVVPTITKASKIQVTAKLSSEDDKKQSVKARPRNRPFNELYDEMNTELQVAYKALQNVTRAFRSLTSAHKREVTNKVHREPSSRTPTALFDKPLVDYFLSRLSAEDLQITRKQGDQVVKVDLSGLTENTPVFRTDLTKLYSLVFKKHSLEKENDRRQVFYQKDEALVSLLTTGNYNPKLEEQIQQIRDGTLDMTIFSIQRFLNHHLSKIEHEDEVEVEVEAHAENLEVIEA